MLRTFIITLLCLAALSSLAGAADYSSPLEAIASDYDQGALTLDQKVMLQIDAIKYPERLPDRYRVAGLAAAESEAYCPTAALVEIYNEWNQLASSTQDAYLAAFARVTTTYEFVSPSGFFRFHYETSDSDAVPSEDLDLSGVPDFIEASAAYLDTTLAYHDAWSFLHPPSDNGLGGDTLFDVYFEDMGYYGYAVPEGPGAEPWNDAYSYLVLNNNFLGFPSNNDPEGDQAGAAKVTCAHEFHHCVQFAYDPSEDLWVMELDATATEDFVFDHTDDNYNYLPGFFNYPEKSLMENTQHAYTSFLWHVFLAERVDTSLMRSIWEGARYQTAFQALSDTLSGVYGMTSDSAFAEFAVWDYLTGGRDDGLHYGETYPYQVKIGRTHTTYPVPSQSSPLNPAGYSTCYIEFYPGSSIGKFHLTVNGDDARQWAAYVVKSTANDVHTFEKINLAAPSYYGVIDIPDFENYYRITLVVANVSEFSSGAFFSYSASVIPPYAVSSAVMTLDSAVYSGGRRNFEYEITNDSPLSDVLYVTAYDSKGWIPLDTFDISLGPLGDSVIQIPVMPPDGTALAENSRLIFKVWSHGNPAIVDSQTVNAYTVLQHGDCSFDGDILIDDLTYLVAYLFTGGAMPQPVEQSGDVSCDGPVNVSDLTELVGLLFQGNGNPTCNPY